MTPDELEATLGRNVRSVRITRQLTQVEVADLANVSLGALKRLESGAGSTTTTLVKVLRAVGREDWLDALAPDPAPFNPLQLLEERTKQSRRPKGPPRVRRRGSATP